MISCFAQNLTLEQRNAQQGEDRETHNRGEWRNTQQGGGGADKRAAGGAEGKKTIQIHTNSSFLKEIESLVLLVIRYRYEALLTFLAKVQQNGKFTN